jgi:diaminohydroxyphosphoribosylaminopyrimidine deaminase / 5-amino-6-(5-phosphoribosylamino)uracil reductase
MSTRSDTVFMRAALALARRGRGKTSPNPMVGAVIARGGKIIARGWHHAAGQPHAEIEALRDAEKHGVSIRGATLYVTLEPCCTFGRTPPCTDAIIGAGLKRVVVGATDPNPKHSGRAFGILRGAGIQVVEGVLSEACTELNRAFNHWIVQRMPLVTVKAAMTLDGKIATASGQSKWITGERARAYGMQLRRASDAILVGINTVILDDPSLTVRSPGGASSQPKGVGTPSSPQCSAPGTGDEDVPTPFSCASREPNRLRRIILDPRARTPLHSKVASDKFRHLTTVVVSPAAPKRRVVALAKQVAVLVAPGSAAVSGEHRGLNLRWLLQRLGSENVTSLLVEGGGETNASFLFQGLAQRVAFFYAPKILGGRDARRSVAGPGAATLEELIGLNDVQWRRLGDDLLLEASVCARGYPGGPGENS